MESSVVDNQVDGLANITSKVEHELSQVWRQIGVMYSQLTANKAVLDKLSVSSLKCAATSHLLFVKIRFHSPSNL